VLTPLQMAKMPLAEPPPRDSRFGSPLQAVARALGAARDRGSDLPNVDQGQPAAAGVVSGAAGGQAGASGRTACPASAAAACQLDAASVMDFRSANDRNLLRDLKPLRPLRENVLGPLASVRSANATICHKKHCIDRLANAYQGRLT